MKIIKTTIREEGISLWLEDHDISIVNLHWGYTKEYDAFNIRMGGTNRCVKAVMQLLVSL